MSCDIEMSCDMSCEEGTGSRPDGPRYKAIGNSMAVPVM